MEWKRQKNRGPTGREMDLLITSTGTDKKPGWNMIFSMLLDGALVQLPPPAPKKKPFGRTPFAIVEMGSARIFKTWGHEATLGDS